MASLEAFLRKHSDFAFIAMPFQDKFEPTYQVISESLSSLGFPSIRADEFIVGTDITDEIFSAIESCGLFIADFSSDPSGSSKPNANVCIEFGYAKAMGKTMLLLTDDMNTLTFDMRQMRTHRYDQKSLGKLRRDLDKMLPMIINEPRTPREKNAIPFFDGFVSKEEHDLLMDYSNRFGAGKNIHDMHQEGTFGVEKDGQMYRVVEFHWGNPNVYWSDLYKNRSVLDLPHLRKLTGWIGDIFDMYKLKELHCIKVPGEMKSLPHLESFIVDGGEVHRWNKKIPVRTLLEESKHRTYMEGFEGLNQNGNGKISGIEHLPNLRYIRFHTVLTGQMGKILKNPPPQLEEIDYTGSVMLADGVALPSEELAKTGIHIRNDYHFYVSSSDYVNGSYNYTLKKG